MAILGHLIVIAFVASAKAQTYQWKDIDNSCTQLKSSGTAEDTIGNAEPRYWSWSTDVCANFSIISKGDNTFLGTVNADLNNPDLDHEQGVTVTNPNNQGQAELFYTNGTGPVRVITMVASEPNVGYAVAICDFESGNVPKRLYVMAFPSASKDAVENLKKEAVEKVPDVSLNPANQGADCKKNS
ncbi:hypothetical protein CHUAL_006886 [Chamberlinius hualienensis]